MMTDLSSGMQGIAAESGKATGSAMKGAGEGDGDGMAELFKVNQIWYRSPPTLSLCSKRTFLANQAQRSTYTQLATDVISFVFNTGELYVNMASSYLYFKLGYQNPARYARTKAIIAQGNALSLFEEIHLLSASGTEICREQNKGLREAFRFYYTNNREYIDTYGQAQGATYGSYSSIHDGTGPTFGYTIGQNINHNPNFTLPSIGGTEGTVRPVTGEAAKNYWGHGCSNLNRSSIETSASTGSPYPGSNPATPTVNTTAYYQQTPIDYLEFVIPMDQVLGCFRPYMNTLFPAGALAGARLEMRLKNPIESLQFMAGIRETDSTGHGISLTTGTINSDTQAGVNGDPSWQNLVNDAWSGLTVSNIYMVLDAFQLQDSVLQILNQVAAGQQGISVMFDTYDHTSLLVSGTGSVEAQVQQARSRISKSWCVVRDSKNLGVPCVNSLAAEGAVQRFCASSQAGWVDTGSSPLQVTVATVATPVNYIGNQSALMELKESFTSLTDADAFYDPFSNIHGSEAVQVRTKVPSDIYKTNYGKPVVSSYQAQLGSLFFPQQPLTTPVEYYANALFMWGKSTPDRCNNCAVTYQDFLGGLGVGNFNSSDGSPKNPTLQSSYGTQVFPYGLAVYGMLAEKSSLLQLSGLPLSNARLLRHKFTFATPPVSGGNRIIDTFTDFTRMFKLFLGGRIVVRE